MEKEKLEQNKREEPVSFAGRVAGVGFFGGLFWPLLGYMAYYLNFTKVGPALILAPWAFGEWKNGWLGQVIGILAISIVSIGVAFAYRFTLARLKGMVPAILFGAALWALVFYLLRPMFPDLEPVSQLGINTISTTLCLYILYGLFIGYSISFEYEERHSQQKGNMAGENGKST
ncbi:YqhR family membrane protein [Fictibacillus iocasae]|uniref:YqhR family membrane protein n=1 Tax=Fictibacillus iocasae TaxID=2715437 RepID=A0ABW2NQU3_9BACL